VQGYNRSAVNVTGELQKRMQVLKLQAEHVMAGIICNLSKHVGKTPQILTDALRCVFTEAPSRIEWSPCSERLGCWVSDQSSQYCGNDDVYTINLLTGISLCNGLAPSRLPESIVGHQVYQTVFPNVEFDVTATLRGDEVTYRTVDAVDGSFYSWCLKGSELIVTETCSSQDLELLPRVPQTTPVNLHQASQQSFAPAGIRCLLDLSRFANQLLTCNES
jgi:hypothetical protein